MTKAIILAGGQKKGLYKNQAEPINEALIPIGQRYMIEYVVEALGKSKFIDKIVIAGPDIIQELYSKEPNIFVVSNGDTTVKSLIKALEALSQRNDYVLVVTSDIPLLTTRAIDDFISLCLGQEGDLFYPIVEKEINENRYPGIKRTYVSLKEGVFTGGNVILLNPQIANKCAAIAEEFVRLRKKPLSLASYLGWGFLLRYILGKLSIRDAEEKVSKVLGIKGVGVISSYPELGIDVDKYSDLEVVTKALCS